MSYSEEEISAMVEKKGLMDRFQEERARILKNSSGLFNEIAISYIAASSLGIDLAGSSAIGNLKNGTRVTVFGLVVSKVQIQTYIRKNGKEGTKMNFYLDDHTGKTDVIIWDEKTIESVSSLGLKKGYKLKLINVSVKIDRYGKQVVPDKWSAVMLDPEDFPSILGAGESSKNISPITDIDPGGIYNIRGEIIARFDVRSFKRKSGGSGQVLNLIIMDDSSSVKVVLWDDAAMAASGLSEGEWCRFYDLSARKNRDIIELHSSYISRIEPERE